MNQSIKHGTVGSDFNGLWTRKKTVKREKERERLIFLWEDLWDYTVPQVVTTSLPECFRKAFLHRGTPKKKLLYGLMCFVIRGDKHTLNLTAIITQKYDWKRTKEHWMKMNRPRRILSLSRSLSLFLASLSLALLSLPLSFSFFLYLSQQEKGRNCRRNWVRRGRLIERSGGKRRRKKRNLGLG